MESVKPPVEPPVIRKSVVGDNSYTYVWILALFVLAVMAGIWHYLASIANQPSPSSQNTVFEQASPSPSPTASASASVDGQTELDAELQSLDQADLNAIDKELDKNNEDSSQF